MVKFCLAASFAACTLFAADYFPLAAGNSWTYREAHTGESFTIRAGTPVVTNDQVYYSLTGYTPKRVYARVDERGELVYLNEDDGSEQLLASFTPTGFGWWQANQRICDQEGQTAGERGTHEGPAGILRDVLDVRYRSFSCADAGATSEQYAENIGMLRRVVTSFAGPRTFDLVSARIGNLVIESLPYGRFTVTSDDTAITLRLETRPTAPLKLRFPTAQEYDVVVRDYDGNVLWRWSDGQLFDQAMHERSVSGEWWATVRIPRPENTAAYTVEGFLTTEGGPRFAATIPSLTGPPI